MDYWTQDELDRFLGQYEGHPHQALWLLAAYTGARKSELLGLKWEYVDLAARTIRIEHNLVRNPDGTFSLQDVKQPRSRRTIPLRRRALERLTQHRKEQLTKRMAAGSTWTDLGMVFERRNGNYLTQSNVTYHFTEALRKSDVKRIRFHDLRHTAATRMLALGMSIFEVSRILGHASTAITTDVYGHLSLDTLQASVDRLDALEEGSS